MGRRKIEIKFINDDRNRSVTFIKRKNGLFKKAHELSILTGAKVTVHVEDIKERQFDYVSANLGGEGSLLNHFQSDDEDEDGHSLEGVDDGHDGDLHESASSVGSTSVPGSKRDSGIMRSTHHRSHSSLHQSPNPNVPSSRRTSGHPYPRSPNVVPMTAGGLVRPSSMDFGMMGYNSQVVPAGGPQRKNSIPSVATAHHAQYPSQQQQQQYQHPYSSQPNQYGSHPSTPQASQFYFQPNQSQPAFGSHDSLHAQSQQQLQGMPRYNGSLFQTNGHPATNSQQHIPAYPSNLVPSSQRPHSNTLPSSSKGDIEYAEFGGSLEEYMEDDRDFDPLGTQASTPGNYDFSTNPSLTNLNMTSGAGMQNARAGFSSGPPPDGFGGYMHALEQYPQIQQSNIQQPQPLHQQQIQQVPQLHQQRQFYNNPSGAQSTPNLAWTLGSNHMSPGRR